MNAPAVGDGMRRAHKRCKVMSETGACDGAQHVGDYPLASSYMGLCLYRNVPNSGSSLCIVSSVCIRRAVTRSLQQRAHCVVPILLGERQRGRSVFRFEALSAPAASSAAQHASWPLVLSVLKGIYQFTLLSIYQCGVTISLGIVDVGACHQ